MSLSKMLAWIKFRFDLGSSPLAFINFAMLVMVLSDKIVTYFNFTFPRAQLVVSVVAVLLGFILMLVFAEILLRIRYFENYLTESNKRNPIYDELLTEIRSLKKEDNGIIHKESGFK